MLKAKLSRQMGIWLLVIFILFPMAWGAGYSLLYSLGGIGYLSRGWTLQHWFVTFSRSELIGSFGLSIYVASIVTLLLTILTLSIVLFSNETRKHPLFVALLCIQLGTPTVVLAVLTYHILSGGGLLSRLAFQLGFLTSPSQFPALVNDIWALGIIVALFLGLLPLMVLYFSQLHKVLRAERLCRLAESLGATPLQARFRVMLPMLLRRGRSIIVLVFLLLLGSYEIPLLLGRQSPQMISVTIQRRSGLFDLATRPQAFVLATLYFGFCCILLALYFRGRRRDA